jgi:hypothetical protein
MAVWQECSRRIQKMAIEITDGWGLVQSWMARLEGDELILVLTVARQIWNRRNTFVFENLFLSPLLVLNEAKSMIVAFESAITPLAVEQSPPGHPQIRWQMPPLGVLKLNWDTAVNKEMKTMGVGAVIRNEERGFRGSLDKGCSFHY